MDWVEFILNNNAALASFIGLGVMVAIVIFMIFYATSHLMKDSAKDSAKD